MTKMTFEEQCEEIDLAEEYSERYAEYIMSRADPSERLICNGDDLIRAMEDGYMWDEYEETI